MNSLELTKMLLDKVSSFNTVKMAIMLSMEALAVVFLALVIIYSSTKKK
jgi:hypothetical protein